MAIRLVVVVGFLSVPPAAGAAEEARLEIGPPARQGSEVVADVKLHGMFDADIMATLQSGLPVNLVFRWTIWQEKHGWRDVEVDSGQMRFRIYFDMLEEDYNIFNAQGRPLATCEALVGVESVVCDREGLVLGDARRYSAEHTYYVEMEALIEAFDDQQVRGFEGGLLGQDDGVSGGPVTETPIAGAEDDGGLTSGLSGLAMDLVRRVAGINDRTAEGKSPVFRGW